MIAADQLGFGETATGERRTYARAAWTDHALALLDTPVRESGAAMFPAPRQRWVDDLALPGAELASIMAPVLLLHGREDRVVPWRSSSAQLVDLLSDGRRHVLSRGGRWTMSERTADFLAVIQPFLAA